MSEKAIWNLEFLKISLRNLKSILKRYSDVFAKCILYTPCKEFDGKTNFFSKRP